MHGASRRDWFSVFVALAALLALGCAPTDELDDPTRSDGLLNGTLTYDHPEVGSMEMGSGFCTATLVRANVAITAAHCVGYGTQDTAGTYGSLTLYRTAGDFRTFTIARYRSFARAVGTSDIALLLLAQNVPADFVTPASLASSAPARGTSVTIYGFGCTDRDTHAGTYSKRRYAHAWGSATANLCPGDSGGPTLAGAAVVRINSGYWVDAAGRDIFGDVPANLGSIDGQITAWNGTPSPSPAPTPTPRPAPSPTPTPTPPPVDACASSTDCGSCTARASCGWCAGQCRTGTSTGSTDGVCSGGSWAWVSSQCSAAPTPPPVPADPCASSADCASCTARSTCGWCNGSCRTGTGVGSNDGVCHGTTWAWYVSQCR